MSLVQVLGTDREGNKIVITGENTFISEENFRNRFGSDFSFDTLYNHPNSTDMWKDLFNDWKEKGIIE